MLAACLQSALARLSAHCLATKSLPPCLFVNLAASKRSSSSGAEDGALACTAWGFNVKMLEIIASVLGYLRLQLPTRAHTSNTQPFFFLSTTKETASSSCSETARPPHPTLSV